MPRDCRATLEQTDRTLRRTARGVGRRLQHAIHLRAAPEVAGAPSTNGRIGMRSPRSLTRKARSSSTICSRRRRSIHCSAFCWRARSGTTSRHIERLRRVLSGRRSCLSAASANRRRSAAGLSWTFSVNILCARPGPSKACSRRRRSTCMPTMPRSASISGSRRRRPTSVPGQRRVGRLPRAAARRLGDQGL